MKGWLIGLTKLATMNPLATIQEILRDVFLDDELEITNETTAGEVDGWDSLSHVTVILKTEQAFGVRFRLSEVAELENVGQLVALVERELSNK